jgi:hypothetical protein
MDMNYLYQRRGEEELRAEAAACNPSRAAHAELAGLYASLIRHARSGRVASGPAARG